MLKRVSLVVVAAGLALIASGIGVFAQAQRGATPPRAPATGARGRAATPAASTSGFPRTPDRKPDFNGFWQTVGTAHWNIEAHSASEGVPAGFSVVEGGALPYQPAALATRNQNFQNR